MINKVQILCECDDKLGPDNVSVMINKVQIFCECDDKQGTDIV